MAKRFTDSEKWNDPWFSDLSASDKLLFLYLLDSCDHAGLWKINMKLASFQLGFQYSLETVIEQLGNRITVVNDDYLFIPKFINFQYPNGLNPNWNSTKSVISKLHKYNLLATVDEQLNNSMPTPQDEDKDKDKDKEIDKAESIEKKEKEQKLKDDAEIIWQAYPNKQGKKRAIPAIKKALKTYSVDELKTKIDNYVKTCRDPKYIAHGCTWFCGERYEDDLTPIETKYQSKFGSL